MNFDWTIEIEGIGWDPVACQSTALNTVFDIFIRTSLLILYYDQRCKKDTQVCFIKYLSTQ